MRLTRWRCAGHWKRKIFTNRRMSNNMHCVPFKSVGKSLSSKPSSLKVKTVKRQHGCITNVAGGEEDCCYQRSREILVSHYELEALSFKHTHTVSLDAVNAGAYAQAYPHTRLIFGRLVRVYQAPAFVICFIIPLGLSWPHELLQV